MSNLFSYIASAAPSALGDVVLTDDTGQTYSWQGLFDESARLANLLLDAGLGRGDRVAVQVEKSPESLFLYLACLRAGLVYLPLNTAYQRAELSYFLRDATPRAVVCRAEIAADIPALAEASPRVFTLEAGGQGTLRTQAAPCSTRFDTVDVAADDLAAIIYTSGTTGRSKGAMVTHSNLASNAKVLIDYWAFSRGDVLLHALPIFHIHGLFVANHCALLSGARMIWQSKFDAAAVIAQLPHATVLMGVPTFYTRLLDQPSFTRETCAGMRLFISGSAPLLVETFVAFERRIGQRILERYGMSEAGMITSNPLEGERKAGTVGLPLPGNQVRIANDEDKPLPTGGVGGIQIRGPNVFKGYWQMPEKTREEFTVDGWFRTGDVGRFDAAGYLSIVGRAKDLIITGGYNVYPMEIELLLDDLPGVLESAVIGVPHKDFGEAVTAIVVPRNGVALDSGEILARLKQLLANYKVPKQVFIVDSLPRNAMGKVQKNVLRERYG
ncbi:MAG TPA: malonyl-CoA synthase [Burkholderiales bacterium]|nr:malonyl-CoA synthase [Burkholderiales bacterium]